MENKAFWLNYLNNKISREQQKITITGITNWVLVVTIAALIYRLLDEFPIVLSNNLLKEWSIFFIALIINLLFIILAIGAFVEKAFRLDNDLTRRVNSEIQKENEAFILFITIVVLLSASLINLLVLIKAPRNLYLRYPAIFFLIIYGIQAIATLFLLLHRLKYLNKSIKIPNIIDTLKSKNNIAASNTLLTLGFIILCIIIFIKFIHSGYFEGNINDMIYLIKFSSEIIVIFLLGILIISRLISKSEIDEYLKLETKILLDEIEINEISKYIEEKIIGIEVEKWIDIQIEETKNILDCYSNYKIDIENEDYFNDCDNCKLDTYLNMLKENYEKIDMLIYQAEYIKKFYETNKREKEKLNSFIAKLKESNNLMSQNLNEVIKFRDMRCNKIHSNEKSSCSDS